MVRAQHHRRAGGGSAAGGDETRVGLLSWSDPEVTWHGGTAAPARGVRRLGRLRQAVPAPVRSERPSSRRCSACRVVRDAHPGEPCVTGVCRPVSVAYGALLPNCYQVHARCTVLPLLRASHCRQPSGEGDDRPTAHKETRFMTRSPRSRWLMAAAGASSLALVLSACSSGDDTTAGAGRVRRAASLRGVQLVRRPVRQERRHLRLHPEPRDRDVPGDPQALRGLHRRQGRRFEGSNEFEAQLKVRAEGRQPAGHRAASRSPACSPTRSRDRAR